MKVAFIIHVFPRLHNTFILNEIIELIRRGFDVTIFSIYYSNETILNEDVKNYELMKRTIYFQDFVEKKFYLRKILGNVSECPEMLSKYANSFDSKTCYSFKNIAKILLKEKYDVIHAGLGGSPATAGMILSELTGIPFTFECHAYDLFVDFPFSEEKISLSRKVFTISEYNKNYLISRHSCPASNIIVKRVPFNKKFCDSIKESYKSENIIVSVCRLHVIKGLEYALNAVAMLKNKGYDFQYIIIGDGPLKQKLLKLVADLKIESDVIFTGDIPNEDALKQIKSARLSLIPSIIAENGDRDGIPTALIESMYLETPVIGSNVSGIPELVDDGVNGFLVEPKDSSGICDKIIKILDNPEMQKNMGENAKKKIIYEFDIDQNMEKMVDVFKNIQNK